ncbi:GMC oxidoreductase [Methylotenera sp.]|uniref:GMC oxidoreductase n=1 Tax=Methylotenera sp. TaxID=2051956 RepID=UPI0027315A3A|nr:GMC family oxidoreductase [Methylotenera sp.]MDP2231531.1 GMC family oxidoreductase [Methylotenera sp.]
MLVDMNAMDEKSSLRQYDVCVVGAGPAGITIARVLAGEGKTVALLEGGGLEYAETSQSLYQGKSIGLNNWNAVKNCRLRYFGGTSNHWGGRCSFLDSIDFEQRDNYFGLPGWPSGSREDMFKYFSAACTIVDLPKDAFKVPHKYSWKGTDYRYSDVALSPPTRFASKYREELKKSGKIDVFINANLTNIVLHEGLNTVKSLEIRNYKGDVFSFSAKNYVLALGAIENARMLLNSDKQARGGVGNQHDMVGRCFMEHFNVEFGRFVIDDKAIWTQGDIELNPTESLIRNKQIGNAVLKFNYNYTLPEYGRFHEVKRSARNFICQSETVTDLTRKLVDFDCSGDGVITSLIEQTPNLKSRITLDSEKDPFGLRRIILNWKASRADDLTIRTLGREVAKEMARNKIARVQLKDFILDENIDISDYGHHCHQMGTTRMSDDPKFGVVDKNQRVHGIDNLFIAGSSVFSTGGGCNPTLTIVMMSLRLGKHIARVTPS